MNLKNKSYYIRKAKNVFGRISFREFKETIKNTYIVFAFENMIIDPEKDLFKTAKGYTFEVNNEDKIKGIVVIIINRITDAEDFYITLVHEVLHVLISQKEKGRNYCKDDIKFLEEIYVEHLAEFWIKNHPKFKKQLIEFLEKNTNFNKILKLLIQ